ncbi:hypothetical protein [Acrocarpospora corrugata]|uniref:hypothetical protein n=1 Tax=Acrocarpospora corrugata TaxID=35763 RepID=UPI0012D2FB6F|nr:hypothetical protein [Acrocarpospora corrugata]
MTVAVIGAVASVVVGLLTVVGATLFKGSDEVPSPVPAPTTSAPATPTTGSPTPAPKPSPSPTGPPVRRSGDIAMKAGLGYDLDSLASNWKPTDGNWYEIQDLGYFSGNGGHILGPRNDGKRVAVLGESDAPGYTDCTKAKYHRADELFASNERISGGRAICVVTSADRYALLKITSSTSNQVKAEVTVWQ